MSRNTRQWEALLHDLPRPVPTATALEQRQQATAEVVRLRREIEDAISLANRLPGDHGRRTALVEMLTDILDGGPTS